MKGIPNCRDVAIELSLEQDVPGHAPRRRSLKLHLLMCRHCRRYARQLAWLRQALTLARSSEAADAELPAAARARIHDRLHNGPCPPP